MKLKKTKLAAFLAVLLLTLMGVFAAQAEELEIRIAGDQEITFYAPYYDYHSFDVCWIENESELYEKLDGSPKWSYQVISTGDGNVSVQPWSNRCTIYIGSMYGESEFEYLFTCTWGDLSAQWPLKIKVKEVENLPEELNVPWPSTRIGETFTFDCEVSPDMPEGAEPVITMKDFDTTAMEVVSQEGNSLTMRALRAGTFPVELEWRIGNVALSAYSCVESANEEGDVPPVEIIFDEGSSDFGSAYVGGQNTDYSLGAVHVKNLRLYAQALDCYPQWGLAVIGGESDLIKLDPSSSGGYVGVNLVKTPTEAADITVRVFCSLNGVENYYDFMLYVHEPELGVPTALNLPDTLELTVGQLTEYDKSTLVLPDGWQAANDEGSISMGGLSSSIVSFDEYSSTGKWGLTPKVAGEFTATFTWKRSNYLLSKEVTLRVADENGVVPDNMPKLSGPLEATLYTQGSRWVNDLAQFKMDNYAILEDIYSDHPVWSLTHVSGDDDTLRLYGWYDDGQLYVDSLPGAGDIVVQIECTWGGKTATHPFTLHVEEMSDLPQTLLPQSEIRTTVGSSFTLDLTDVVPAESLTAGGTPVIAASAYYDLLTAETDGMTVNCTAKEAGTDILTVDWKYANILLRKDIRVLIADASGNVPPMQLDPYIADYTDELYVGAGAYQTLTNIYLDNPGGLSGMPVWHFEVLSGDPSLISFSSYGNDADVYSARVATKPETVVARISCEWDGAVFEMEFTYEFKQFPGATPTGIDLPGSMMMTVGDEIEIDLSKALLPAEMDVDPELCWYFNFYGGGSIVDYTHRYNSPEKVIFEALEPGVTTISAEWEHAGFYFSQRILFIVQDENGNAGEAVVPEIYMYEDEGVVMLNAAGNDYRLAYVSLENSSVLDALEKGTPVWSVETVSGEDGLIAVREDDYDSALYLVGKPSQVGDTVVRVCCTWNGQTTYEEYTLHVVEAEGTIPDRIPLEESYTFNVNDELEIDLSGARPSFWADYNIRPSAVCTGMGENYGMNNRDWLLYIYELAPGEYHVDITVNYGGCEIKGSTIICVTDENGVVPSGFDVDLYSSYETIYVGGNDTMLCEFDILRYEAMYNKNGTKPDLKVTFSDASLSATASVANQNGTWLGEINLDAPPQKPGQYTCTLTATWGGLTVSRSMTLYVIDMPNGAPTGLNLPDRLSLYCGETYVVPCHELVLPVGWSSGMPDLYVEIIDRGNTGRKILQKAWNEDFEYNMDYAFTACTPGIYDVTFRVSCGNIVLEKDVEVINISLEETSDLSPNVPYVVTAPGLTCQLAVESNTGISAIRWMSMNPAVCTVDSNGRVSGVGEGQTAIAVEATMKQGGVNVMLISVEAVEGSVFRLPAGLKEIGEEAFVDNAAQVVVIPDGVTTLHSRALAQMRKLCILVLPDSLTEIPPDLLSGSKIVVIYCHPGTAAADFADSCGVKIMPLP